MARSPRTAIPLLTLFSTALSITPSHANSLLHEMFQDHAVLQRDRPIQVWGEAQPGERVTVSIDTKSAQARADASGHWQAALPGLPAGGPYKLEARGSSGATESLNDILAGDVYLCSGQSNMEFPMANVLNASREIGAATNDSIRLLSVAHASSASPLLHFQAPVAWMAASPATVRDFSAACYFFARELQKSVHVPLGLIHSSWGGARIEPWISARGLRQVSGFNDALDLLALYSHDKDAGTRRLGAVWEDWWRAHTPSGSMPWKSIADANWRDVPAPLRDWNTWGVPELVNHHGLLWYRRTFTLTSEQASGGGSLSLGAINQVDQTWVNEKPIGNTFGYNAERTYQLTAGSLRAGENSLVINVLTTWDAGGLLGPEEHVTLKLADHSEVSLAAGWRYQLVPDSMGYPPRAPWESVAGLTSIYNAMIAPLASYGIRGVLWYQGESNADEANRYQALLATFMRDWRSRFGADMPFLIVELPNFGIIPTMPRSSSWASLREAQRRAVAADAHAALAVTIDVGDAHELHPPDKQAVGARLAQAARHLIYGQSISASGPVPRVARLARTQVEVSFDDVGDGLVTYSTNRPIGFELCGPDTNDCHYVDAVLQSNQVMLDTSGVPNPKRVRFCWGDAPLCNLYDKSGLPAGPFELEIAPAATRLVK
jgi:sialate O-acetylesterase